VARPGGGITSGCTGAGAAEASVINSAIAPARETWALDACGAIKVTSSKEVMRVTIVIILALSSLALRQPSGLCLAYQLATKQNNPKWQIYKDPTYGFSMRHPSNWEVGATGYGRPFTIFYPHKPKPHEFYLIIDIEDKPLETIRAELAEFTRKSPTSRFIEKQITFNGQKAYQFTRSDNPGYYAVYIPHGGKLYVVAAARFDLPKVRQAIRTFQFIN
jgi:hypothetical protein